MTEDWVGYWAAVSGVGATLLGLAFVTFQVRIEHWRSSRLKSMTAAFTLTELAGPTLISLWSLTPNHPWRAAAGVSGVVGVCLWGYYRYVYLHTPDSDKTKFDRTQARLSWLTLVVSGAILVSAVIGDSTGLRLLGVALIWLLISGSIEAFLFLAPPREVVASPRESTED